MVLQASTVHCGMVWVGWIIPPPFSAEEERLITYRIIVAGAADFLNLRKALRMQPTERAGWVTRLGARSGGPSSAEWGLGFPVHCLLSVNEGSPP